MMDAIVSSHAGSGISVHCCGAIPDFVGSCTANDIEDNRGLV